MKVLNERACLIARISSMHGLSYIFFNSSLVGFRTTARIHELAFLSSLPICLTRESHSLPPTPFPVPMLAIVCHWVTDETNFMQDCLWCLRKNAFRWMNSFPSGLCCSRWCLEWCQSDVLFAFWDTTSFTSHVMYVSVETASLSTHITSSLITEYLDISGGNSHRWKSYCESYCECWIHVLFMGNPI